MKRTSTDNYGYNFENIVESQHATNEIDSVDIERVTTELLLKFEQNYSTPTMSAETYNTPDQIINAAIQNLNTITLPSNVSLPKGALSAFITNENLKNGCLACLEECKNVLLFDQNILRWYPATFYKAQEEHPDWSTKRALTYSVYQFAKSQLADKISSELLKICARYFGLGFAQFACSAFMSEATGLLIEYLVDKLFPTLFPANGAGNGTDDCKWLIDLVIFILKYIIVLFICRYFGINVFLIQFLLRIVPVFLKWMTKNIRK